MYRTLNFTYSFPRHASNYRKISYCEISSAKAAVKRDCLTETETVINTDIFRVI